MEAFSKPAVPSGGKHLTEKQLICNSLVIQILILVNFRNLRILIVEDEPKVASFIKKGLEENLYEADVAYDGLTAEKLAKQYKYDLFILDIIIRVWVASTSARTLRTFIRLFLYSCLRTWNHR